MSNLVNYKYDIEGVKEGRASNVVDFFDQIIKPQFQNKQGIIRIHQELLKYIESSEAVFFLRHHFNESSNNYDLLRRGFVSEYACGRRVAFCDNAFAMLFNGPKLNNDFYTADDLHSLFNQRKLIFYLKSTHQERELSYYNSKGVRRLEYNSKGWTLAHINPVGKQYEQGNAKDMFPCLDRKLWDNPQKINLIGNILSSNEISFLKAHFLRLIHPLNSFFLPKNNLISFMGKGKRLGEEKELLEYTYNYLKKEFPQQIIELEQVIGGVIGGEKFQAKQDPIHSIVWSQNKKKVSKKKKQHNRGITNKERVLINNEDTVEEDIVIKLDSWLKSVGKSVFSDIIYPEIKENINITYLELAQKNKRFASYKVSSQKTRLSTAKSIVKNGLEHEALLIIKLSKKIKDSSL